MRLLLFYQCVTVIEPFLTDPSEQEDTIAGREHMRDGYRKAGVLEELSAAALGDIASDNG